MILTFSIIYWIIHCTCCTARSIYNTWLVVVTEKTECYAFSPVVGMRTPPPPHPQVSCPPPVWRGGGGVPIPTRGHSLWYSIYKIFLFLVLRFGMYFPVKTIFCSHIPPSYELRIDHKDKQTEEIVLYGGGGAWGAAACWRNICQHREISRSRPRRVTSFKHCNE